MARLLLASASAGVPSQLKFHSLKSPYLPPFLIQITHFVLLPPPPRSPHGLLGGAPPSPPSFTPLPLSLPPTLLLRQAVHVRFSTMSAIRRFATMSKEGGNKSALNLRLCGFYETKTVCHMFLQCENAHIIFKLRTRGPYTAHKDSPVICDPINPFPTEDGNRSHKSARTLHDERLPLI